MRIGIDLMGGERPPQEYFEAILKMAKALSQSDQLVVLATPEVIEEFSARHSAVSLSFYPVKEVIGMEEEPLSAIRKKRDSHLALGVELTKKKAIDAFITMGNTGALIACCTLFLSLFHGVKRPALLASLPKSSGLLSVVDVGGHVSYKAEHLVQFAYLGAAFQKIAQKNLDPSVGLLNIGTEETKGTQELRKAYEMLSCEEHPFQFVGNVEGREVFQSQIDVLVTDGFTGNVFLKTSEGLASYLFHLLSKEKALEEKVTSLRKQYGGVYFPGALVCGIENLVIKCHGEATPDELFSSFVAASSFVKLGLVEKMQQEFIL